MPTEVISSMTSIGSARNTGPVGGALQSWKARRTRIGSWSACCTSCPFDRRPRYTDEIPEQKRVGDGVPRVLLAGGHDQRRSGYAGIEQAAKAVAEPAGGVKIDKAGPAAACA